MSESSAGSITESAPLRVPADRLVELGQRVLEAAGADAEAAAALARSLVSSNLRGVDSHGFMRIPDYLVHIRNGRIDPSARPVLEREYGSILQVNGRRSFGQIAARTTTLHAIERARESGLALAFLTNVMHVGRLGEFVELAADRHFLAVACCNGGPPGGNVAPFGGRTPALSTNPIAYGIPAGERPPIVADFATSTAAEGKIRLMMQAGKLLPEPWVIDADGHPSVDPHDFYAGGAILPMAGHKGFALSLLVEILGGIVAGEGCASLEENPGNGFVILVLEVGRVRPPGDVQRRVDAVIEAIKAVPPAPGFSGVLVPGELETAARRERETMGIPIAAETWSTFNDAARSVGIVIDDDGVAPGDA